MNKFAEADFLNCGACGYGSCELMATAVFNGLNRGITASFTWALSIESKSDVRQHPGGHDELRDHDGQDLPVRFEGQ